VLASTFIPHPKFSRESFRRMALDFLTFGNGYVERQKNRLGQVMKYESAPAKYLRRKPDMISYVMTDGLRVKHEFEAGSVFHLIEPDINQEVYGLPEYLGHSMRHGSMSLRRSFAAATTKTAVTRVSSCT
jgi:capsid portal protein